jgi:hypothetical protein
LAVANILFRNDTVVTSRSENDDIFRTGAIVEAAIWGFIGTLVGAFVGATASVATTTINSNNAVRLQRNARAQEQVERVRAFQLENFLSVQETFQDLMRQVGRAHFEDSMAYRQKGEWGKNMLSDEVNEKLGDLARKIGILIERIDDEHLRTELNRLKGEAMNVSHAKSECEATEKFANVSFTFTATMKNLGGALRAKY